MYSCMTCKIVERSTLRGMKKLQRKKKPREKGSKLLISVDSLVVRISILKENFKQIKQKTKKMHLSL